MQIRTIQCRFFCLAWACLCPSFLAATPALLVETAVNLKADSYQTVLASYHLDRDKAVTRQTYFFDSAQRELFARGIILRLQAEYDAKTEAITSMVSTVKFRAAFPKDKSPDSFMDEVMARIPASFYQDDGAFVKGLKCEVDASLDEDLSAASDAFACSYQLKFDKAEGRRILDGRLSYWQLFSIEQLNFLRALSLYDVSTQQLIQVYGPAKALVWKVEDDKRDLTFEYWTLATQPRNANLFQLSTRWTYRANTAELAPFKAYLRRSALTFSAALSKTRFVLDAGKSVASSSIFKMTNYLALDGTAEQLAVTPDGMTLLYTDPERRKIGLLGISNLARPQVFPAIDLKQTGAGAPTAVAISRDGAYAIIATADADEVKQADAGFLLVYDISNPRAAVRVKNYPLPLTPKALSLVGSGETLRAVVGLSGDDATTKGQSASRGLRPGRIEVIGLQDLYGAHSTGIQVIDLSDALKKAGALYPNDPQPSHIAVHETSAQAAVALQKNNAFALMDLSDLNEPRIKRIISAGIGTRMADADVRNDGEILLQDSFSGRRDPRTLAWLSGDVIATANEGVGVRPKEDLYSGTRSFSLFSTEGNLLYEAGADPDRRALRMGHYPDKSSAARGIEIAAVASASFADGKLLLVASEEGGFIEVYSADDTKHLNFVQFLPTGPSPRGLLAITGRKDRQEAMVTANADDGSLAFFQRVNGRSQASARQPLIMAESDEMPWGALSGLATDGAKLYAVPDDAFARSRIFTLNTEHVAQGRVIIEAVSMLRLSDGSPVHADLEGITKIAGGFWLAAEGKAAGANELIKVTDAGVVIERVSLPSELQQRFSNPQDTPGFEGVAASEDGRMLYVALQRGFDASKPFAAILSYDTVNKVWASAQYPLDQHSKDPHRFWTGISEVQVTKDGRLLLAERDKAGGKSKAINAEIKRVYSVDLRDVKDGAVLTKKLVRDLRRVVHFVQEKVEGLVVFKGDLWIVNDNDGAGWTRLINTGKL